jgi:hypothetical protein
MKFQTITEGEQDKLMVKQRKRRANQGEIEKIPKGMQGGRCGLTNP